MGIRTRYLKVFRSSRLVFGAARLLSTFILTSSIAALVYSQSPKPWTDPSPHKVSFITVDKDVRLEVLDWGGKGKPVVLLAGAGATAHVFDDFAVQLRKQYHVFGITRRGFGSSDYAGSDYSADRLGDDVVAVLDALKLNKPVLVGHSLGGLELSSVASRYPDRVAGFVYLEAAYQYAFDNGKSPSPSELGGNPPRPAEPAAPDLVSFAAYSNWNVRNFGFSPPESELRQLRETNPDGSVGKRRVPQAAGKLRLTNTKYSTMPVRALVIFALPRRVAPWVAAADAATQQAAKTFTEAETALVERQAKVIEEAVPTTRVIRIANGNHLVFLSNQAEVLREINAFISRL
jgi:pimeloyl-ACP methyl ester carboxylesterase